MPGATENEFTVLRPALDAARKALQRLDDQDVPAALKKVAASSARTLPRPLAITLWNALEGDEWLRSKALEELEGGEGVPRAFLEHQPGWDLAVARASHEIELARVESERDQAVARLEATEERLRRSRERGRKAAEGSRTEQQALETARKEERDRVRERLNASRTAQRMLQEEVRELTARVSDLASELHRVEGRNADLEARLRTKAAPSSAPDREGVARGRGTPVEVAQMLDTIATSLTRTMHLEPVPGRDEPDEFSLPQGVSPDQAAAVHALLSWRGRAHLYIDGYNLAKTIDGNGSLPDSRRRVEEIARRLRETASGRLSVTVVWDSAAGEDDRYESGVEVRFRPSADEEIADAARSLGRRAVVVTTDRELRERAEEAGATGLWSTALVGWRV